MAGFVQIIELKTTRIEEIRALVDEMRAESGPGRALRGTMTRDRDRPGYYLNVVEFESYEVAMENSNDPQVSEFSARLAALCDGPPRFYNLDVVETWSGATSPSTKAALAGAAAAVAGAAAAGVGKARQRLNERRSTSMGTSPRPSIHRQPGPQTHEPATGTPAQADPGTSRGSSSRESTTHGGEQVSPGSGPTSGEVGSVGQGPGPVRPT